MAVQSLAIKYRPTKFEDVTEQANIVAILKHQLSTGTVKNAYLFCGGAGTGKTTCARIFAKDINGGKGNPIELDAASNNSVEDVREIISRAKTASVESEYKVFILDEVHMLSNSAWNAMLKLLEEPPVKSIFIMCTTDPQKIPKTILSRVQRYNFQRISQKGIVNRLSHILSKEYPSSTGVNDIGIEVDKGAMEYIAKIADGGMRDAITMLDKCLSYSTNLTVDNIVNALGLTDFGLLIDLFDAYISHDDEKIIQIIEGVHSSGADLKLFIHQFMECVVGIQKYLVMGDLTYTTIPTMYEDRIKKLLGKHPDMKSIIKMAVKLNADIKWDTTPKVTIEATLLM